jgi:hypothetical protein
MSKYNRTTSKEILNLNSSFLNSSINKTSYKTSESHAINYLPSYLQDKSKKEYKNSNYIDHKTYIRDKTMISEQTKNDILQLKMKQNNQRSTIKEDILKNDQSLEYLRSDFNNTLKNDTRITKTLLLSNELSAILNKKKLSQCNSPKERSSSIKIKENEPEARKKTTPVYQYNKKPTKPRVISNSKITTLTNDIRLNTSNMTLESKHSNIQITEDGYHNINIQNIINSVTEITDDMFYKDARYFKINDELNNLKNDYQKQTHELNEYKRTIDILKNYIKIQEVI